MPKDAVKYTMKKHSVTIKGHRTSYSLESVFQSELETIAARDNVSLARLITKIDTSRKEGENLSSALRVFVFTDLKSSLGKQ